jgi:predicted RNase H-like HicB family nuclease
MKQLKIVVEKHPDIYVAYPLGLKGVVIGQGDSYEAALEDVKSAIQFHLDTFGPGALEVDPPILEAFGRRQEWPSDAQVSCRCPNSEGYLGLRSAGIQVGKRGEHISMLRENPDGTKTPMTIPNHQTIKKSTLRTILTQSGISREAFLRGYEE